MRHLATIQEITKVSPIVNADRIEAVKVLGWNIVTQKGLYKPGDKAIFCEVDTLLPDTEPRFEDFQKHGQKTITVENENITGYVVKTIRLRGVYSQGVLLPIDEFSDLVDPDTPIGTDVTEQIHVHKYEEPIPVTGTAIGRFDTRFAPKSDAIRLQSITEHWDEIKSYDWEPTVKVDGMSQTLINDNGTIRIFSRNLELNAESVSMIVAQSSGLVDIISDHPGMAVQFELAGPSIQSNRLKLKEKRPFVFAVFQDRVKLQRSDWDKRFVNLATPLLGSKWLPQGTIEEMIEKVTTLRGNVTKDVLDEGIVFHRTGNIPDWMDANINFKIINNKYLLKHDI